LVEIWQIVTGITIGIIPVAVGGTSIKLFDKDQWQSYYSTAADWLQSWVETMIQMETITRQSLL
jgi:hypothetical protein